MPLSPRLPRIRAQLPIRFGSGLREIGATTDLSARGLGLVSRSLYSPSARLDVEIALSGGLSRVTAVVVWSTVDPNGRSEGRMGLRLDHVDEKYLRYLATAAPAARPAPRAATPVGTPAAPAAAKQPRSERFFVPMQIRYGPKAPMTLRGLTKNFSRTGFAMTCGTALAPGERLTFSFTLPTGTQAIGTGDVAWSRLITSGGYQEFVVGIRIDLVQPAYEEYLAAAARRNATREKKPGEPR